MFFAGENTEKPRKSIFIFYYLFWDTILGSTLGSVSRLIAHFVGNFILFILTKKKNFLIYGLGKIGDLRNRE